MQTKKILVIGGGPAGMMAAIRAAWLHQDVILVEKNLHLGKKLLLSGKGRCNLTNACNLDSFLKKFSKQGQFLRDAFGKFFNHDLMHFFEARGLKLKVERQLRVFPISDKSDSILKILEKELYKNKVKIIYNLAMRNVFVQENKAKGVLLSDGKIIPADRIILATGGVSYRFTGSTGDGIKVAEKLGHRIVFLKPALVPLETRQHYPRLLEGLTLKNIQLRFNRYPRTTDKSDISKKQIISDIGELLFTRFGISGPLVLSLSGVIVKWLEEDNIVYMEIDLKPALSREQLNVRFLREFKLHTKRNLRNILKELLPRRMVDVFIGILKISPDEKASYITQEERQSIINLLKGFRLDIVRPRPLEEAMLTSGGVSLKDINPRTMESRIIKGLYFAGEIIDVNADTGGFNLQAAFSTGYLAGESAALN